MAHCTDAFSQGWQHMAKVLFSPFHFGFWLLMAFLIFVANDLSSINPSQFLTQEQIKTVMKDPASIQPYLMTILIIGVIYLFMMVILLFLASAARMLFFVGVRNGKVDVSQSLENLLGKMITYFLWNLIVPMLGLFIIFVLAMIIAMAVLLPAGGADVQSAGIVFFIVMAMFGLFVFIVVFFYMVLMNSFVLPQMIFQDKGIFESWGSAIGLALSEFSEFIGFCLIRSGIWVVLFVVLLIPMIIMGLLFGVLEISLGNQPIVLGVLTIIISLPFLFVLEGILLPATVFLDAYSLAFIRNVTGDERFLPGYESASVPAQEEGPPSPSTPPPPANPPTPPPQEPHDNNAVNHEPVAFKDIPVEETGGYSALPPPPAISQEDEKKEPPTPPHL